MRRKIHGNTNPSAPEASRFGTVDRMYRYRCAANKKSTNGARKSVRYWGRMPHSYFQSDTAFRDTRKPEESAVPTAERVSRIDGLGSEDDIGKVVEFVVIATP